MPADLETVESRLASLLDRYRPELVDGTIYGLPPLVWPGARPGLPEREGDVLVHRAR